MGPVAYHEHLFWLDAESFECEFEWSGRRLAFTSILKSDNDFKEMVKPDLDETSPCLQFWRIGHDSQFESALQKFHKCISDMRIQNQSRLFCLAVGDYPGSEYFVIDFPEHLLKKFVEDILELNTVSVVYLEDFVLVIRWNSRPVVGDPNLQAVVAAAGVDFDDAVFADGLLRVADEVLDLGSVRFMPLFARSLSGEQARAAASFLRSFDLTVSLIGDPDGSFRELLLSRGAGKLLSLRSIPPDEWVPRGLFRVIESVAAIPFRGELPFIRPGRPPPLDVRDPFVVFHVGSGSKEKNWPPESFASLVEAAEGAGYRVFLPEGEADRESVRKVLSLTGEKAEVVNLALTDLAALLAQASFFVGNDSGITHIAGQVGVHTVAVFGPTDPARWKPLGPRVRAVGGRDGSFPSLEEVIDSGGLGQFLENR